MSDAITLFDVRQPVDGISVVDIRGDVTPAVEDAFGEAFSKASATARFGVVLNFSGLDYMNSGGIGLLVTLLVRAQRSKQRMVAHGLTDHYRQIFSLTRLDDAIGIHDTEAAALAALAVT